MTAKSDHYLELNDDGTPRRKHDIEPRRAGAPILHSTVMLALLNVFMLLRNIITWEEKAAGTHEPANLEGRPHAPPGDQDEGDGEAANAARNSPDTAPKDAIPEVDTVKPGSTAGLRRSNIDFHPIDDPAANPRLTPTSLNAPANDNETLYGAAPGSSIGLSPDDPFQNIPEPSTGGGNSPDPWSLVTDDSIPVASRAHGAGDRNQ